MNAHLARLELRLFWPLLALFVLWSVLTLTGVLHDLDRATLAPWIDPRSPVGQIAEAIALVSNPITMYAAIAAYGLWALQRRMRRLATALFLTCLGWPIEVLLAFWSAEPRPSSPFGDAISFVGASYPAGHLVAATALVWVTTTLAQARRRPEASIVAARIAGVLVVSALFLDQWIMRAHWFSDLVGGVLLGAALATGALWVCGADEIVHAWATSDLPEENVDKRAAIIYNPVKVFDFDLFRRRVEYALLHAGWKPPLWLETSVDDPGYKMARDAVEAEVDLVMVAGGDGTVRVVCSQMAHTGIPIGLLPAGTGNLLARNLGVPLDEDSAIALALTGTPTPIDVVRARTDAGRETFAVMSGMGLDAAIMANTNADLKKVVKGGAYVVAALGQLGSSPFELTLSVDGGEATPHRALMALIGNVGQIQAGVQLLPDADPSDGLLDIMLAEPARVADWPRIARGFLAGQSVQGLTFLQARSVEIEVTEPVPCQFDGDSEGSTRRFRAAVDPGALLVVLPDKDG
ncbi:MAG: diacylglycerol kinase family protein [Mobilicoccus sp.]|nr:diacylglycerol kinase family protein [Mobilicoccus sp.]